MTIHRALAELKLIDSRIAKGITLIDPVAIMQKDKLVNGHKTKEEFISDTKSKMQSSLDLIERKNNIKSAIVEANGKTIVTVGGAKMTIADAINFKNVIAVKKSLIESLTNKHRSVLTRFNIENDKINTVALENAKIMLGKQGDDRVKPTDDDVNAIVGPFVKRNEYHLIDPLSVETLIETLQNEVDNFEVEVDAVLSEINAITKIEI